MRAVQEQRHDVDQALDFPSTLPPLRRAKSLDRRTTESVMTVSVYSSLDWEASAATVERSGAYKHQSSPFLTR